MTSATTENPERAAISSGPPAAAAAAIAATATTTTTATTEAAQKLPISSVAAPAVALLLPAALLPAVRPQPDSAYLPQRLTRRWALLVLAGPALTHHRLGSTAASQTQSPAATAPLGPTRGSNNPPAVQQRPGTGFEVRAQASRILNGRWTLSAGLGYQELGSNAEVARPNGRLLALYLNNSITPLTHRDTYRFLTVPAQAHYALGPVRKRLRYGLVAGAEAAVYLGGRTLQADGSVRDWNASNSPYRALSLALSVGLDVRYRLSSRLEAVAQPTTTHFLNPLARPAADLAPRYLWGGSALLGLSYHLR